MYYTCIIYVVHSGVQQKKYKIIYLALVKEKDGKGAERVNIIITLHGNNTE